MVRVMLASARDLCLPEHSPEQLMSARVGVQDLLLLLPLASLTLFIGFLRRHANDLLHELRSGIFL